MLLIGVYLLIVDVLITLCTVILLGGSLLIFMRVFRKTLSKAGRTNQKYQGRMIKWVNQSLGGIKEVKVSKREQFFIDAYARNGFEYVKAQRRYSFLNQLPKPFIETVCIVGMMGIIIFVLKSGREANAFIPQIAVFAMAAFRLMPSMSRINTYLNAILFYKASIDLIFKDLKQMDDMTENEAMERGVTLGKSIDSIHVQDVSYQYPGAESCVFEHVNFNIPTGKSIAFIGPSGSGKTTIADLLLGILRPEKGEILAGGLNINENPKWWSGKLGYIPQFIYLSDEDIRSNVAFGIAEDQISDEQVWKVLEQAQLKEFVQSLPDKLDTFIGERGIRLSGGQRQRIGIARALYHNPEILVLDEATSSLDNETEQAVMDAIETLHGKMTLIIIAHRLSTIKNCDIIYEVRDKKIISGAPRI